jgi:hypothetical protein
MKIIVDIAKTDWPHFYPDFFPQVEQICTVPANTKEVPYHIVQNTVFFGAFCIMFPTFSSYEVLPVLLLQE